jgi:hypothetical protein
MRGLLKLLTYASHNWGAAVWLTLGAAFLLAQIVVLRKRYLYIGFLGLAFLTTAARRIVGESPAQVWLVAVQVLAFGNAVVFMVMHSRDNMAKLQAESEERRARLLTELAELARRPELTPEEAPPEGSNSSSEAARPVESEPTSDGDEGEGTA